MRRMGCLFGSTRPGWDGSKPRSRRMLWGQASQLVRGAAASNGRSSCGLVGGFGQTERLRRGQAGKLVPTIYSPRRLGRVPYQYFMDRINKFLAHAGLGSRRHCEMLVRDGRVQIDGHVVRDLATRVGEGQAVTVDGRPIAAEKFV